MTETPQPVIHEVSHEDIPQGKKITVILMWVDLGQFYELKSITNTTYYKPGVRMSPKVAQIICDLPNWDVTMVKDDMLEKILGIAGSAKGLIP